MQITQRQLNEITPYSKNAKEHPEKQVKQIANSITEFGFNQPIVVDKQGIIVVGHGRYEAAKLLEMQTVPVLEIDIDEQQASAYRLADNKLNESEWNMGLVIEELKELDLKGFNIELTGFDRDIIIEPEERDDHIPSTPDKPKSKLGDIYLLGGHRLMCGSSTSEEDVVKLMDGHPADMMWTDPPYNVNYEGGTGLTIENDNMSNDDFYVFLLAFYKQAFNVLKLGGPLYVAHADMESINFRKAFIDSGLEFKQCIIWVKNTFSLGRADYQWQHEPILYGWKPGEAHKWYGAYDKSTVIDEETDVKKLKKDQLEELVEHLRNERKTTVIREKKPARSSQHPTMKPVALINRFILNSSQQGELVYDPFGGSGSTLIACEKLNRKCNMMELDPRYVDVIVERYKQYTDGGVIIKNGEEIDW